MSYSPRFLAVIALVLEHEGGYQEKHFDRGNWTSGVIGKGELKGTNFGISAMAYPHLDIRRLTREQAIAIYHRDYWLKIRGDDLPFPLAAVTMDAAVNSGPRRAVEWLQKALGVTADGQLGPVTMHAAGNAADPKKTAARACRHRIQYLAGLQGFAQWSASWLQRTLDVFRLGVEGQP